MNTIQNITTWSLGIALASCFYGGMIFLGSHLSSNAKKELSNWLDGLYVSTWPQHFCLIFDTTFGKHHFSKKRIKRSAIASVVSVVALYIIFNDVLNLIDTNIPIWLSFTKVIALGAIINIIPDYFSLIETRWLLERFGKTQSFFKQLFLLLVDLLFTATIIWFTISIVTLMFFKASPSIAALVSLYSEYAIFFYSTFLTSLWAWVYCLSTWFLRIFRHLRLRRFLDVRTKPDKQIALVGAFLVLAIVVLVTPSLKAEGPAKTSAFDKYICEYFQSTCLYSAIRTNDPATAKYYISTACTNKTEYGSCGYLVYQAFSGHIDTIQKLWKIACEGKMALACYELGKSYELRYLTSVFDINPFYSAPSFSDNILHEHFMPNKCTSETELKDAANLYKEACNYGYARACTHLGYSHEYAIGVAKDEKHAFELYKQGCYGGDGAFCLHLGKRYEYGAGVNIDVSQALALYRQGCISGDFFACSADSLGSASKPDTFMFSNSFDIRSNCSQFDIR